MWQPSFPPKTSPSARHPTRCVTVSRTSATIHKLSVNVPTHRPLKLPRVAKFSPFQRTSFFVSLIESWNQRKTEKKKKKKLRLRCATDWCGWRVRGRASCTSPNFSLSPSRPSLSPSLSLSNFHSSYLSQTVCCINSDTFPHGGIETAPRRHAAFFCAYISDISPANFPRNSSLCPAYASTLGSYIAVDRRYLRASSPMYHH